MVLPSINKHLLPIKAHFFAFNAATGPIVPFMPTYAKQLGFSTVVVGTIYTFLPVFGMLAKPMFGAIADKFHIHKLLFIFFQVMTAIMFFGIYFIPESPVISQIRLECGNGATVLDTCVNNNTIDDHCAASNVLIQAENQDLMTCELSCFMEDDLMWSTVCTEWKETEHCRTHASTEKLEFIAHVQLNKTVQVEKCVNFRVIHAEFDNGDLLFPNCPKKGNTSSHMSSVCDAKCNNAAVKELITKPVHKDEDVTTLYQFWLFFILMILSWVSMAVVVSIGDAICFEMLGDKPNLYGQQRLFGSIGWGIFSIIAGLSVDYFSRGQLNKNYSAVFFLMAAMLAFDVIVSLPIKYSQTKMSTSILRDVGKLVSELRVVIFMLWCIFVGLCTGLLWQFLFWHLEDLATANNCDMQGHIKTLEGLIMGIQCFGGELPFFFLSGWILKRIGHVNAMSLVLLGFGVRFILYSLLTNPWWSLPIELLNGITFGVFYATMASYASIAAPPGTEATVQGLVGAVFEGVGVSLGSLIGGVLYSKYGGSQTFQLFGIAALMAFLLHAAVQYLLTLRDGRHCRPQRDFDSAARYAAPSDAFQMIDDNQTEMT